ncbi:MAG: HYR domain-containing protein, partial [Acidobacteriota bacterium]
AGPETELCLGCGVDPTFSFVADLAACDNAVRVTAEDDGGQLGDATATVRYDDEGPTLTCPDDIFTNVPFDGASRAEVFFTPPSAADICDGSLVPSCLRSDEDFFQPGEEDLYRLGTTNWSCNRRDTCNNLGQCGFRITVLPFGAATPAAGCEFRDFRDFEQLDFLIPGVINAEIGEVFDYEEIAFADGGYLEVQSAALESTVDHGVLLYRPVTGDFRAETPLPALDRGLDLDDVGGLMMRWGLDERSPRAAVLLRPNDPAGPMIEFRVRPDFGLADQAIATRVSAVGVTDIALELEGDRVTAQFSTDGGHTWITPTGGLGGAATVAVLGDTSAGIFVSGASAFGATFVFPYMELCPILGVDPGPGDPPAPEEGCRDDDFGDDSLDADWTFGGLGNANQLAIAETGGRLEVTADGATAFTGSDNAGFVHRSMSGDFRVEVTVDGDGMTTGGAFRKAGLMVRSSLDPWAPRVLANLVPYWNGSSSESHLQFVARQTQGGPGNLAIATDIVGTARVARLAIERRDDVFIVQYSLDGGATWTTPTGGLGGSVTVAMPETVLVGLDVVSNDISTTSTAAFDDFSLCPICRFDDFDDGTLGAPWTLTGLGNANQASGVEDLGVFALTADGATAFTGADNAGYLHRQVTGDFRAEVTVDGNGMTTGGAFRKTGLMVRSSLDPWAPRLLAQLAPFWNGSPTETHLQFVARQTQGGPGNLAVATDVIGVPRVVRLAIERVDDVFSVEYSLDGGTTWIQPTTGLGGSVNVTMPATVLIGLDMVSNDISITSTAEFDDFALCLGTP